MTKSRGINRPRIAWSAAHLELLRLHYADSSNADLAAAIGCRAVQVSAKAARMGMKKSAAWLAGPAAGRLDGLRGMGTRFQPGQQPLNKGVAMPGHGNPATFFKPGSKPHNHVPVGSLREAGGYLQVKLTDTGYPPRDWVPWHRRVWEQAHGPLPAGRVVAFKAGRRSTDPALITPDALECITRLENMRRNSVHSQYPPEVARLVQLRGAITRQINRTQQRLQQQQEESAT